MLCEYVKFILTPPRHCLEKDPVMTSSLWLREKIRAKNKVGDVVNVDVSYSLGTERGCW